MTLCSATPYHRPTDTVSSNKRDAEHRESLSTTLRTLRADSLRQTDTLQRLQDKLSEAQRKVALAEADENALRAQLKTAEATIHKLKDEAARTKKFVAETRAACANEVRKRDRQIEGLKKAASDAGRARGERKSTTITTIHVTGEVGDDEAAASTASTMAEDYDLRQETNGFLAQLAKGLSEENETLLSLIRKTNHSLKHMSGWDKTEGGDAANSDGNALVMVTNPQDLATDIDGVLGHLRTMLTNPSFVPLEEVVVREEEIFRLRHGWEKMEERWREAVHLIDSWRRRMAANGQPVDMEDLKMGLRLSPVRVQNVEETAHNDVFQLSTLQEEEEEEEEEEVQVEKEDEAGQNSFEQQQAGSPSPPESLHLVPAPRYEDMIPEYEEPQDDLDDSDAESSIFQDDVGIDIEELQEPEPNVEILHYSTTHHHDVEASETSEISESIPLPQPPRITPLEETPSSGNRKPTGRTSRKRSGDLIDQDDDDSKAPLPPSHSAEPEQSPQKRLKVSTDGQSEEPKPRPKSDVFTESNSSLDSILLLKPSPESSVSTAPSRATARSTRSEVSSETTSKKEAPPSTAKPTTRRTRAAAQEKKETPSKPLPRQRQARATAATASSSARAGPSQPSTATKARAGPTSSATTDMPPPPRPTRSANNSPAVQSTQTAAAKTRKSPVDRNPPAVDPEVTTAPETTSRSRAKRVAESPIRSPGKSASRLPKPRNIGILPPPQQSPLSMARIAAKLAASEREADAARVRAKLKAARLGNTKLASVVSNTNNDDSSLAPSQASTTSMASSRVISSGDPTKRDRLASASSTATRMSGGGNRSGTSSSLDENGQTGGVSISRVDSRSPANPSLHKEKPEEIDDNKTVVPSPSPRRRRDRLAEKAPVPSPPAATVSSRKGSPTKPADHSKDKTRKREPRSRSEKVASRRRSTLSPWELQSLIAGEVVPPTPRVPEEHLQPSED